SANALTRATSCKLCSILSGLKRGMPLRRSPEEPVTLPGKSPVNSPLPKGLYETNDTSNSLHTLNMDCAGCLQDRENSDCKALIGWIWQARRNVASLTSDKPIALTLPCSTRRAIAPIDSSTGTCGSIRCK